MTSQMSDTPAHFMGQALLFTQTLVEVHDSIQAWKFNSATQKARVNAKVACVFSKIIKYAYGADDNPDVAQKLTGNLASAALCLTENFFVPSQGVTCPH